MVSYNYVGIKLFVTHRQANIFLVVNCLVKLSAHRNNKWLLLDFYNFNHNGCNKIN